MALTLVHPSRREKKSDWFSQLTAHIHWLNLGQQKMDWVRKPFGILGTVELKERLIMDVAWPGDWLLFFCLQGLWMSRKGSDARPQGVGWNGARLWEGDTEQSFWLRRWKTSASIIIYNLLLKGTQSLMQDPWWACIGYLIAENLPAWDNYTDFGQLLIR